jgi:hypothetical protein
MISEMALFNELCSHAAKEEPVRALFITPNALERDWQKLDMINTAAARGLNAIWRKSDRTLLIGPAIVYLRTAHRHLDEELRDQEWNFIHGLEHVEVLANGTTVAANLTIMARL